MSEQKFVHLRIHTEFSLSDGLIYIPSLMEQAAANGMGSIAITDQSNLYAAVKFFQSATSTGIKPIIGVDIWVEAKENNQPSKRLTLLCQNHTGYLNLLQLLTKSYLEGQESGKPVIKREWLRSMTSDLIALSGAIEGEIGAYLLNSEIEKANETAQEMSGIFQNRFYIELQRVGIKDEIDYTPKALKLAELFTLPVVATNAVRFLTIDDYEAHEARVCIQEGVTLNDPNRTRSYTDQQYFKSTEEMQQLFADIPEALENSVEIAKRCNLAFVLGKNQLPHFHVPGNETIESHIADVAYSGLDRRIHNLFDKDAPENLEKYQLYKDRLARELAVINKMGFAGYFLIVADFTRWAKENGIPVGPGRGSGPGSLVAYALFITDLDPLALDLLFERFLNPERVSMPDFDIDFCMEGRDRVIEYVMQKHGHECVSQIITYGTMAAKAVVRDVGRVLALSYGFVDKIAKLIPFELGITLEKALEQEPLLRQRYQEEEEVKTLIDLARKLEGLTRNVGKHAGGIVIAPGKLTDFVPLYCEPNEAHHPVTQFDKDDVEAVGLVKFDFLGLKTLTIIDRALTLINQTHAINHQEPINISLIPLDDAKTFALLKACHSTAVFQLESHGMRDLIKRLQPDCFEDLVALVALFRPGPLQSGMVDDFINRKHGRAKVLYAHPQLEPVLRPTYGVILYQEQVMQIAQVLAGYTLGAADILRRAMGKKKPEEMAKQREIFCKGAVNNGVDQEVATYIFDLMEKFAGYGFNKSHSASYALIAYQTAWLKAHYPAAFMAAVLSSDMDKTEKIIIFKDECETFDIKVSPPDINSSDYFFRVVDNQHLMYGLGAIKGVGFAAIENIMAEREANGAFKDIFDFCARVDLHKTNRRTIEAFIKSGCFDSFGKHRAILSASLNNALQKAEQATHNQTFGQHDLLSAFATTEALQYVECEPWGSDQQLLGEKETLGFYLTGHPIQKYAKELTHLTSCRIADLSINNQKVMRTAGVITNIRTRQTKRGDRLAIFTLDDGNAQIEVVCFSEVFQKYRPFLIEDQIIIAEGEVGIDDFSNSLRMLCRELLTIESARSRLAKHLAIEIATDQQVDPTHLKSLLSNYLGGSCPIMLHFLKDNVLTTVRLGKNWQVNPTDALIDLLNTQLKKAEVIY